MTSLALRAALALAGSAFADSRMFTRGMLIRETRDA
jgi:hypothetical protein